MAYAAGRQQGNALGLPDDETKALEQTRQRLYQLSNSIQSFRTSVAGSNPLPPMTSLQAQYQILLHNLKSLLEVLAENAVPFAHTSVHPAVNFPGRTQENILLTLLRKKREPGVEERVERGLETTAEVRAQTAPSSDADGATATGLGDLQDGIQILEEVWSEVSEWTKQRVETYVMEEASHVYTKKEREMGIENVKSGLRRPLREPGGDDEDEDDEDSEEEGDDDEPGKDEDVVMGEGGQSQSSQTARQAVPEPELLFWFAARGDYDLPKNVELEKDAARRARMGGGGGMPRM